MNKLTIKPTKTFGLILIVLTMLVSWSHITLAHNSNPPTWHHDIEIYGYAWSSNIGWISFNCSNNGVCSTSNYKVLIDHDADINGDHAVTGYAWSSNVGWLKFGGLDLTNAPGNGGQARMSADKSEILGWAKFVSGTNGYFWDGWVSLNCQNNGNYCITSNHRTRIENDTISQAKLDNFAWGNEVIGWVNFSWVNYKTNFDYPCNTTIICTAAREYELYDRWCDLTINSCSQNNYCVNNQGCNPINIAASFTVNKKLVRLGDTVEVTWNIDETQVEECQVISNTSDTDDQWLHLDTVSELNQTQTSVPIVRQNTDFTLSCKSSLSPYYIDIDTITVKALPNIQET